MKILSYEANGKSEKEFFFPKIQFGKTNLIVGDSGTGKTKLLNAIFNGASSALRKNVTFVGYLEIILEHNSKKYRWVFETGKEEDGEIKVIKEVIYIYEEDKEKVLLERTRKSFLFEGNRLPKLSPKESAISILKDEESINPIYKALSSIMRRNFSGVDLHNQTIPQSLPQNLLNKIKKTKNLDDVFVASLTLSCKLYILSEVFKDIYKKICNEFQTIFPFVSEVQLLEAKSLGLEVLGIVPVFAIKEKLNDKWISLSELSSGMIKVLLILSDIFILPKTGGVYIIDEYENSLGLNAINFFPTILLEAESKSQFIITSHHPYIIGNIPVKDWIVFHRKGNIVNVKQGIELEEKFGKSKQQSFIQLVNDPFYAKGVE